MGRRSHHGPGAPVWLSRSHRSHAYSPGCQAERGRPARSEQPEQQRLGGWRRWQRTRRTRRTSPASSAACIGDRCSCQGPFLAIDVHDQQGSFGSAIAESTRQAPTPVASKPEPLPCPPIVQVDERTSSSRPVASPSCRGPRSSSSSYRARRSVTSILKRSLSQDGGGSASELLTSHAAQRAV